MGAVSDGDLVLNDEDQQKLRDYLTSIMPTREMVDQYVTANSHGEISCIPDLGWVPRGERQSGDGVDDTYPFYSYGADRGRRAVNFPDRPSRIHTFGNSFTHCDQVSDGETWQEYLASHLQEPVRNFGVGGWSVYQAFRRMRVVESGEHRDGMYRSPDSGADQAEYLILNAWSDDHYRNLDAWRSVRMGRVPRWTLPYLRVSIEAETFEEMANHCPTLDDHYKLCDADWVCERFREDPVLRAYASRRAEVEATEDLAAWVADGFGFSETAYSDLDPAERIRILHREAALFATRCVIEMAEAFAKQNGRQLMVLLSLSSSDLKQALVNEPLYDQTLLDWLATRDTLVTDLRDPFRQDFARSSLDVDAYLAPFYNGHHTPRGNYAFAWGIKDRVVDWLDPKPLSYG
ncbi:TPA: hypothetical protein DCE37_09705 [Candidatus Latescibacteria bacterium]|nr:hypothetical protein [Candidatus Latescibacterota bacterium]